MKLDRFYPIFDDVSWLHRMLPRGVKLVQLRLKDRTPDDLWEQIVAAKDLCAQHSAVLVVNDHWQMALAAGCDFIHLGQEDLETADLPAIRRAGVRLGVSTHDLTELDRALAFRPDYIALGPVYPTILKQMKWQPQGLDRVTDWKKLVGDIPLVAIGGMSVARAPGAFAAGADSVSVVTDITLTAEPEQRLAEWLAVTR